MKYGVENETTEETRDAVCEKHFVDWANRNGGTELVVRSKLAAGRSAIYRDRCQYSP